MKLNPGNCHLFLINSDIKTTDIGNFTIKSTKSEKLLGVIFDNKTFNKFSDSHRKFML